MARKKITTSILNYLTKLVNGIIYFYAALFLFSHLIIIGERKV